ncbi:hypothetical protein TRFO_31497 [Tritrichomonas foetus]|uniref:Centromere protein J C-terminal domain-containing protein n=1 Tax=Tritrichomonas foetus TaxID=1144522 RepID=A0A1J4JWG4_9EUKA|nr:hypothetical protein TRFO_31497 [Tritrichomonas foetus]|eukprot:OHT01629.1 hypothetical protein TRFO_31497 [Tritrichomonas foetus]
MDGLYLLSPLPNSSRNIDLNQNASDYDEEEDEEEEEAIVLAEIAKEKQMLREKQKKKETQETTIDEQNDQIVTKINTASKVGDSEEDIQQIRIDANKIKKIKKIRRRDAIDQITQTNEANSLCGSTQTEITENSLQGNEIINEFIPKYQENEFHIDSQIERIENAIQKLGELTNNCNNLNDTNEQEFITELNNNFNGNNITDHLGSLSKIEMTETPKKKKKRKTRGKLKKKNSKPKKKSTFTRPMRRLSPKMSYENFEYSFVDKKKNNHKIPTGSPRDPIVLRSGYPIVFDYEPKDPIRREKTPHGPLKTFYKNGDCKMEFQDGSIRVFHREKIFTYYPNGDKQLEFCDGVNAYRYQSNGSVEFRCPDNTLIYFFPNGQIEEHFSNGETKIRFPDRSVMKISPDKSCVFKDKNGKTKKGKIMVSVSSSSPDTPPPPSTPISQASTPTNSQRAFSPTS